MTCFEPLKQGLAADEKASLKEIQVLKAHLKSLRTQHDWLVQTCFRLKSRHAKKLAKETQQEIFNVGTRLKHLQEKYPNAFKEI